MTPRPKQTVVGTMPISLALSHEGTYTCLDWIEGSVSLDLPSDDSISSINVKLQGVSRTSINPQTMNVAQSTSGYPYGGIQGVGIMGAVRYPGSAMSAPGSRYGGTTVSETHKVLYLTNLVFPDTKLTTKTDSSGFKMSAGKYTYPFRMRIPVNMKCVGDTSVISNMFSSAYLGPRPHATGTLPPSLSGLDPNASVRYFVKVTVSRPGFLKRNMRAYRPLVFLPMEPPRPKTRQMTFYRREHQFIDTLAPNERKSGLAAFLGGSSRDTGPKAASLGLTLEARLPTPAILVPLEPVPLFLFVTKMQGNYPLFLRSLKFHLHAMTFIKSQDFQQVIPMSHVFFAKELLVPLLHTDNKENVVQIDPIHWSSAMLPDTVAPSFETCNIKRVYQMEVTVGISKAEHGAIELVHLLAQVAVFSGITAPPELLAANQRRQKTYRPPEEAPPPSIDAPHSPPQKAPPPHSPPGTDAPGALSLPTYDEAVADTLQPTTGPRPNFRQAGEYFQGLDHFDGDRKD